MIKSPAKIIDGKLLSEKILKDLHAKIKNMPRRPGLAAVLIGDDPASELYVRNKKKASDKVGMYFHEYRCAGHDHASDTEQDIINAIKFLNADEEIDAIIVQLPMPKKFDKQKIMDAVAPEKDVDALHSQNIQKFTKGDHLITPPLVNAVLKALDSTGADLTGKKVLIVSKGNTFAQPIQEKLLRKDLAVTIIRPGAEMAKEVKQADILISVVGQPGLITKEMIKPDAIIIDIGTTLIEDGSVAGDVDKDAATVASYMTPVPGGIGPMTVAMLLRGTYELALKNQG